MREIDVVEVMSFWSRLGLTAFAGRLPADEEFGPGVFAILAHDLLGGPAGPALVLAAREWDVRLVLASSGNAVEVTAALGLPVAWTVEWRPGHRWVSAGVLGLGWHRNAEGGVA